MKRSHLQAHKARTEGIASALEFARTVATSRNLTRISYLPASFAEAPLATGARGNRRTASTSSPNQIGSTQTRPQQTATINLGTDAPGQLRWQFQPTFNNPPAVTVVPHGPPPGGATVYILSKAPNEVIVTSTDPSDTRLCDLTATGNPD